VVCVDFDGTITDRDTFDVLVDTCATPEDWARYRAHLRKGSMSLRDELTVQAGFIRLSLDEADALLAVHSRVEPSFVRFVERCEREGIPVTILSAGIGSLSARALARAGIGRLSLLSNDAIPSPKGWQMVFRDASDNGFDKAASVRALQSEGNAVTFVGDGYSDFDAAVAADVRFAKRDHALARFLKLKGVEFTPFSSFTEIERALFG
jgi:2-hydroxy-3-keto-5-methylthiopentenyl-1-phosphate phosphatase